MDALINIIADEQGSSRDGVRDNLWGELRYSRRYQNQEGTCPKCKLPPQSRAEPFLQLPVPVPTSGFKHSLASVLSSLFAVNDKQSENIKCSFCCVHDGTGTKCTCLKLPSVEEMSLTKSPANLFLCLCRYSTESKIKTPIEMEEEFKIQDTKYKIHGAILHKGNTVHQGHYIAYVEHGGSWFLHDDDKPAIEVEFSSINRTETYVILAKKIEGAATRKEVDHQFVTPPTKKKKSLTEGDGENCQLCINSTSHHCQSCKRPVCNFHSVIFDENEMHRIHPQCQAKQHKSDSLYESDSEKRISELKDLKSKRSDLEDQELLHLLTAKSNHLKQKKKSKTEEEKKVLKSLSEQISRLKRGKQHYSDEKDRKSQRRQARTPEELSHDRQKEKEGKSRRRQARTPEELSRDRQNAKEGMSRGRGARTPEEVSRDRQKAKEGMNRGRQARTQLKNFKEETKYCAHFVCICCHRMLFKTSVQLCDEKMEENLLSKRKKFLPLERVTTKTKEEQAFICKTCIGYLKKNKMPKMAVANHLSLNPIPKEMELTIIEGCCIAKLIIFQQIRLTPKSRWRRLQDRLISVPVLEDDVINTISQLPRTPEEAGLVAVSFKRKLEYKTSHIKETLINPHKLYRVLAELVKNRNPYYKEFQNYQEFKERCIHEDQDGLRLIFPQEEEFEDILNLSDMSIDDDLLPNIAENVDDPDQFEEEEYRMKDPVKKFQLEGHDRSSAMNNKYPEETFEDETLEAVKIAPAENKLPINLLSHQDWDIRAFPYLHNYDGSNGLHQRRDVRLSLHEYIQQRVLNHDPRFRENFMYLYSCVGAIEKNQIQRNINLSYSRGQVQKGIGSGGVTMKLDDPYVCLEDIKNTPRYWKKEKYVMQAKLENLGAFQVFFTLSCADGRWPEVMGGILAEKGHNIEVRTELCDDGCQPMDVNRVYVQSTTGNMVPLNEFLEKESQESRYDLVRGSVLQVSPCLLFSYKSISKTTGITFSTNYSYSCSLLF